MEIDPSSRVSHLKEEHLGFLRSGWLSSRLELEAHLKQDCSAAVFEQQYLVNVSGMNRILAGDDDRQQKTQAILALLGRGEKQGDVNNLEGLVSCLTIAKPDFVDAKIAMDGFYGAISAPAKDGSPKLWQGNHCADNIANFLNVLENGFYVEKAEELALIHAAERAVAKARKGAALDDEDHYALSSVTREYLAFLTTYQHHFHDGEENLGKVSEILKSLKDGKNISCTSRRYLNSLVVDYVKSLSTSNSMLPVSDSQALDQSLFLARSFIEEKLSAKSQEFEGAIGLFLGYVSSLRQFDADFKASSLQDETIEQKVKSVRVMLRCIGSKDDKLSAKDLDELASYMDSREYRMKKEGILERKVYCSVADARKRFIDAPASDLTREMTKGEIDMIMGLCFGQAKKATCGEIFYHAVSYSLLGLSYFQIMAGNSPKSLLWAPLIGLRALMESYYATNGGRVMTAAMTHIFMRAFEREGINAEAAFNEYESLRSRAFDIGYMAATPFSLAPVHIAATSGNMYPMAVPVASSLVFLGMAYATWWSSVNALKKQVNAQLP